MEYSQREYQTLANSSLFILAGGYISEFFVFQIPDYFYLMACWGFVGFFGRNLFSNPSSKSATRVLDLVRVIGMLILAVGFLFRTQHWPFAIALIILGCIISALAWISRIFIIEYPNGLSIMTPLAVALAFVSYPVMFLFKIMHWPFGQTPFLFLVPTALLLVGLNHWRERRLKPEDRRVEQSDIEW